MTEDHVAGSSLGPTFRRILADQFQRLRDGDRFWYERVFAGRQLDQIERTSLADIVRRNSTTTNVQENVFVFDVSIRGTVFNDQNANGRQDRYERGLPGWGVNVLDSSGNVVSGRIGDIVSLDPRCSLEEFVQFSQHFRVAFAIVSIRLFPGVP